MTDCGGTTSANTAWRVHIAIDGDTRVRIAEGEFGNGYIAKLWMCDQLRLISLHDPRLRPDSGYHYSGVAEAQHDDVWRCRLNDSRMPIAWDTTVGGRRG